MFALVADVERYPEFLPWCTALRVKERAERDGNEILMAHMTVAFKALQEHFTSRVTLDPEARRIEVEYVDGPFRSLINNWRFEPGDAGGVVVDFFIDFDFRSRALGLLMSAVFSRAVEKVVQAFEERARAVYGTPAHPRGM
jgi:coenzyme Q-binding protein COQ10